MRAIGPASLVTRSSSSAAKPTHYNPYALEAMIGKIGREIIFIDRHKRELAVLGEAVEGEDATVADALQEFEGKLTKAEKTIRDSRPSR